MADRSFSATYGDGGPSAANNSTTTVPANVVRLSFDTVWDFMASRRTSSFLGQDSANLFAAFDRVQISQLDFYSDQTS